VDDVFRRQAFEDELDICSAARGCLNFCSREALSSYLSSLSYNSNHLNGYQSAEGAIEDNSDVCSEVALRYGCEMAP